MNVIPRKVLAELSINDFFHVEIDITGISRDHMDGIAAKNSEAPFIHSARRHPLF
ncbi:MAG TPA: hypothetical protein VK794_11090 [Steroidobacteraceae bacterium]|nr:hypothetical protein [Steroidobacteraceae bacterium]